MRAVESRAIGELDLAGDAGADGIAHEFRRVADADGVHALRAAKGEGDDVAIGGEALAEAVGQAEAHARASGAGSRSSRACRRPAPRSWRRRSARFASLASDGAKWTRQPPVALGDVADGELGEDLGAMGAWRRADRSARRCSWRRHCSPSSNRRTACRQAASTPAGLTVSSKLTTTGAATGGWPKPALAASSARYLVSSRARA